MEEVTGSNPVSPTHSLFTSFIRGLIATVFSPLETVQAPRRLSRLNPWNFRRADSNHLIEVPKIGRIVPAIKRSHHKTYSFNQIFFCYKVFSSEIHFWRSCRSAFVHVLFVDSIAITKILVPSRVNNRRKHRNWIWIRCCNRNFDYKANQISFK